MRREVGQEACVIAQRGGRVYAILSLHSKEEINLVRFSFSTQNIKTISRTGVTSTYLFQGMALFPCAVQTNF